MIKKKKKKNTELIDHVEGKQIYKTSQKKHTWIVNGRKKKSNPSEKKTHLNVRKIKPRNACVLTQNETNFNCFHIT